MGSCRICDAGTRTVLDLGDMPLANKLKTAPDAIEKRFPLALEFCAACGNLQLGHCVEASDLYDDYLYITPTSPSLEAHSINLVYHMQAQGYLPHDAFVLEFGSNIGHFLRYARTQAARVLGDRPGAGDRRDGQRPRRAHGLRLFRARDRQAHRRRARPRRHRGRPALRRAQRRSARARHRGAAGDEGARRLRDGERLRAQHRAERRDRPDLPRAHVLLHRLGGADAVRPERARPDRPALCRQRARRLDGVLRRAQGHPPGAADRRGDHRPREGDPDRRAARPAAGHARPLAQRDPDPARPLPRERPHGLALRRQRQGRDLHQRGRHHRGGRPRSAPIPPRRRSAATCRAPASASAPRPRRSRRAPTTSWSPPGTTATS